MYLSCLGLNHTTAPIGLLERLTFSEAAARSALERLPGQLQRAGGWDDGGGAPAEAIILSTCNRIEIYAASPRPGFDGLERFLCEAGGIPLSEIQSRLYRYTDADMVQHLLEVAAGLDSLVLGEPQILGQVTRAFELAHSVGASGPLLSRLFQCAIHAGKRVHAETSIGRNPASISSLAASLAESVVAELREAQIVILGVGEMAELAVEALRKRGADKILVVNRSLEHAQRLAGRWSAEATTFQDIRKALVRADVVIASTGSPHILVDRTMVASAMQERPGRALVLIDIALPRNIDAKARDLPWVRLFDLDDLNARLESSLDARAQELPLVRSILAEEKRKFLAFLQTLDILPVIAGLHRQAETVRRSELEKTVRRLPDLNENERAHLEAMSVALVKKLLDAPIQRLRASAGRPEASELIALTRALFGLADETGTGEAAEELPLRMPMTTDKHG